MNENGIIEKNECLENLHISKVTTSKKVGYFVSKDGASPNKIKIVWLNTKDEILKDKRGRVYILVVNEVIFKIGGSQDKGGMKRTISAYTNCMNGSPSDRSFVIHKLIRQELDKGNSVDVYMITSEPVVAEITGLFGTSQEITSPFKEMENKCVKDYVESQGCYPPWNFQESGKQYPQKLLREHAQFKMEKNNK
jgi:hypothetical protein